MNRFAWDIDHIIKRQEYYKELSEVTTDEILKENYGELYDMYSLLILERLFASGEVISSGISNKEKLESIKEEEFIEEYPPEISNMRTGIVKNFLDLDPTLPYVQFSKSMNGANLIKYIGDAIHNIFGHDAYQDYKSLALDSTTKIQIGNQESRACFHHIPDSKGKEYYILLPKQSNIMIVNSLAHEAGHHHRIVVNDAEISENHLLREYESFNYEIRVLDYFIKNGIYKKEALKAMIRLINLIDSTAGMYNNLDLIDAKTMEDLTNLAHKRNLYQKYHIPNNELLLDYLYTIKTDYMFPYIFSALCVFEDISKQKGMENYERVINEIGKIPEMELVDKIVENREDINNLVGYRQYKKEIKKMYGGQKNDKTK